MPLYIHGEHKNKQKINYTMAWELAHDTRSLKREHLGQRYLTFSVVV